MKVAARTGHSSFYVEKGRQVLGKTANELGKLVPLLFLDFEKPAAARFFYEAAVFFVYTVNLLSPLFFPLIACLLHCLLTKYANALLHWWLGHLYLQVFPSQNIVLREEVCVPTL